MWAEARISEYHVAAPGNARRWLGSTCAMSVAHPTRSGTLKFKVIPESNSPAQSAFQFYLSMMFLNFLHLSQGLIGTTPNVPRFASGAHTAGCCPWISCCSRPCWLVEWSCTIDADTEGLQLLSEVLRLMHSWIPINSAHTRRLLLIWGKQKQTKKNLYMDQKIIKTWGGGKKCKKPSVHNGGKTRQQRNGDTHHKLWSQETTLATVRNGWSLERSHLKTLGPRLQQPPMNFQIHFKIANAILFHFSTSHWGKGRVRTHAKDHKKFDTQLTIDIQAHIVQMHRKVSTSVAYGWRCATLSNFHQGLSSLCESSAPSKPSCRVEGNNRRKFRSQTSDNMDRWKAEMGRVREEKRREEDHKRRRSRCAKR